MNENNLSTAVSDLVAALKDSTPKEVRDVIDSLREADGITMEICKFRDPASRVFRRQLYCSIRCVLNQYDD